MKIRGSESLPEVRDAGPASVRRNLKNDPAAAAMGAAAGYSSKAGQYIARGALDLAAGIEKGARDRAEAKTLAAYNDYVSRSSQLLYDPNAGLMHAKGAGAEGLSGRAYQAHKELKDEILKELPAGQRKLFMERTASYDRGIGSACMKLEGEQMSLYKQNEAERTLKTIYTAAALNPDAFSMEAQEDAFRDITIARYGDQGAEANLKNSTLVRSEFFIGMISQVAQKDPLQAEGLVKEYAPYIEPADAEKLKLAVEKAVLPVKAQSFAEEMLKKHGIDGASAAVAETRKAFKGKNENAYLGYVNSLFADAKQEREARREAVKEGFYGVYNRKGSFSAARDFINRNKEVLGEAGYASFMDMAQRMWEVGKYAPKPDKPVKKVMSRDEMIEFQRVFNEGKNFVLSGAVSTPGQMAAFNDRYGEALRSLSGDDRAFQDLLELTAPKAGGTDDKRGLYSANEMVSKRAEDAGILRSYEAYRDFDAEWLKACEKRAADEGRPLTKDEMVTEGDRLIEEKVIAGRAGFFSSGPLKAPEYQFRRLGVRAEDVRWNQKTNRYEVEKDGQFFMLEPDKDFYKLAPLKGDKRNFTPVKR